ncbi:hypothetical protein F889_00181 [Acinetobacter colistiniresistens]|uniref:CheW-like domain-containing protein n=1 Tax=Acinetobacter colistiniresistens TaxID=280145 RepID=N9PSS1_9GAMM|nr:hypothetical protein [Acinetobacter colistiniresistens]ENX36473.1 hypothetical protein F889_00181 [Acinetobacter colistiniresistens]
MVKKSANSALGQIDQQELQHLITVSTGFIDAYIIECHQNVAMLLPQNIVLSAMDTQTNVDHIEWHDLKLPVYAVNDPMQKQGVALVVEGDDVSQRFALVCNQMPESIRLRISEVVDEEGEVDDNKVFKYVKMGENRFYVPHLQNIQTQLGL